MDTDSSNIWQKIFWQMVTVFHHIPVNTILNFDGLAGKHQKHQNFPPSEFCAIQYYSRYHIRVNFAGQKSHGFMASNLTVIVFPLKLLPSIYSTSAYKTNGLTVIVEPQIHLIKLYCKNFCLVVVQIYIWPIFVNFRLAK